MRGQTAAGNDVLDLAKRRTMESLERLPLRHRARGDMPTSESKGGTIRNVSFKTSTAKTEAPAS